ncbi:MAG: hypothetical protein WCQ53_00415 [bacterium]
MLILIALNIVTNLLLADPLLAPRTCKDLLPDVAEYIDFMEEVGNRWIANNPVQAKKVYDVLAIRRMYQETTKDYINPIDNEIKDFVCACYTENKDQVFASNSTIIRKYSQKNINKLIKTATNDYVKLKVKIYDEEYMERMTAAMRKKVEKAKRDVMITMQRQLNYAFKQKLESRRRASKKEKPQKSEMGVADQPQTTTKTN